MHRPNRRIPIHSGELLQLPTYQRSWLFPRKTLLVISDDLVITTRIEARKLRDPALNTFHVFSQTVLGQPSRLSFQAFPKRLDDRIGQRFAGQIR